MIWLLVWVMFIHWIGDFVCQTQWMAENKSNRVWPLTVHVATYTATIWAGLVFASHWHIIAITQMALLNGGLHWITDFCTSKFTSYFKREHNIHAFFATIGFDQFIHISCLMITTERFLS